MPLDVQEQLEIRAQLVEDIGALLDDKEMLTCTIREPVERTH